MQKGIGNVQVHRREADGPHVYVIEVPSLCASLHLTPHTTVIDAENDAGRLILRDIIVTAAK